MIITKWTDIKAGIKSALVSKSTGSAVAKSKNARPEAIVKIPDNHLGKRSVLRVPIPHIDAPSIIEEYAVMETASDIAEN